MSATDAPSNATVAHLIAFIRDPDTNADWFTATLAERREGPPMSGTPTQDERRAALDASGMFTEPELEANIAYVRCGDLQVNQVLGWVFDVSTTLLFRPDRLLSLHDRRRTSARQVHSVAVNGTYRFPRRQFTIGWPKLQTPGANKAVEATEKYGTGWESRASFIDIKQTELIGRRRKIPAEQLRDGGKIRRIMGIFDSIGLS
ncbi:hypothetical protein ABID81_002549 [Frigoribacterium sp. PvP054]|uniref:hypothetical protein n=1 Tax=Frigoribacterium sp. PvP054 TaxID=3156438 RepID=UPI003398B70A